MNDRVPDSSGLPLRAMVMVLIFLGVVFLLFGLNEAFGTGDDSDANSSSASATSVSASTSAEASAASSPTAAPAAPLDVYVYNISGQDGAAQRVTDQLVASDVDVAETTDLPPDIAPVDSTTVFYPEGEEGRALAEQVGGILQAPFEVRGANLAEQPPGIVVLVTG